MEGSLSEAGLVPVTPKPGETSGALKTGESMADVGLVPAGSEPSKPDEPSGGLRDIGLSQAEPSGDEALGAIGRGMTRGVVEAGPMIGGLYMGAGIGAFGGPASPVTVPLGAFIGMFAGYFFGKEATNQLQNVKLPFSGTPVTLPFETEPAKLRKFSLLGEAVGSGMPFAAGPVVMAQRGFQYGTSKIGNFLNGILDFAKTKPKTFLAIEGTGLVTSGIGEAIAEQEYPGRIGPRILGGVAGGFLNPGRLAIGTVSMAAETTQKLISAFSPGARESRAGARLVEIFNQSGENIDDLMTALAKEDIPGIVRTPAQRIDSVGLRELETRLKQEGGRFGTEAEEMAEKSLLALENMMTLLMRTGDPDAFMQVGRLKQVYFKTLLENRVAVAQREATEAAAKITGDSAEDLSKISVKAHEAASSALEESRKVERELWDIVDQTGNSNAENIVSAYTNASTRKLPEDVLDPVAEAFIKRMEKWQNAVEEGGDALEGLTPPTVKEIMSFRTKALELSRKAADAHENNFAKIYGDLAESALDDIDDAIGGAPGYLEARTFSRELNDTFTRSFMGNARQTRQYGQAPIPPEVLLRRATAGGKEASALKLKELEEAVRFLPNKDMGGAEALEAVSGMLDAQERFIRLMAAEAIDPDTSRISPARLKTFMKQNAELLNNPNMAGAKAEIEAALASENGLQSLIKGQAGQSKIIAGKAAFAKMTGYDNAADAVKAAINSPTPITTLNQMGRLVSGKGAAATEGFRSAVWDYAIRGAKNPADGSLNFTKLKTDFFGELRPGQESLVKILERHGAMSPDESKNLTKLFDEVDIILKAQKGETGLDELLDSPDALLNLTYRVIGSKIGSAMAGGQTGPQLIASARGSSMVQQVMEKVPGLKTTDLLMQAAKDPRFMKMLISVAKTQAQDIALARSLHAYLFSTGFIAASEGEQQ